MISIIAAIAKNGVIGRENKLPWHLLLDMRRFKALTTGYPVIMGRKTFESLGEPLKGRRNIVVANKIPQCDCTGYFRVTSLTEAIALAKRLSPTPTEIFIIGGSQLFKEALPLTDKMYLTLIDQDFEGDIYFPPYDKNGWVETDRSTPVGENGLMYEWVTLARKI